MLLSELYIVEAKNKRAALCFGRMNPPTLGHKQLLDKTKEAAGGGDYFIFPTKTKNLPDNPLSFAEKYKFITMMFPEHAAHVVADPNIKTIIQAAEYLYNKGYRDIVYVAGSDRLPDFQKILDAYNGKGEPGMPGYYKFDNIEYFSAGERDPDSPGLSGISASKARAAAAEGNFKEFTKKTGAGKLSKSLYDAVRKAMGIEEDVAMDAQSTTSPIHGGQFESRGHGIVARKLADIEARKKREREAAQRVEKERKEQEQKELIRRPAPGKIDDEQVEEEAAGVGVIANKKQAKDPRYCMSLTKDVRPGAVGKSLRAFNLAEDIETDVEVIEENLRKWFKEKWVRFGPDGKIKGACARGSDSEGKPKCLPQAKAHALGKKGRASAAARKRKQDPNPERRGKAINVATKKKTNESINKLPQVRKYAVSYKVNDNINPEGYRTKTIPVWALNENAAINIVKNTFGGSGHTIKNLKEYKYRSDKKPQQFGLSGRDLIRLAETNNTSFVAFESSLQKKLQVPRWVNKMESYGLYVRTLHEQKNTETDSQDGVTPIESKLFAEFKERAYQSIDSANVGDKVALLSLTTFAIPGHKTYATLQGFLEPKEIIDITTKNGFKQLQFSDGSKFPQTGGSDGLELMQSWQMTKLFDSQDAASKAFIFYAIQGPNKSEDLELKVEVDQTVNEAGKKDACYHKVRSRYKVWPSAYASGALVQCRKKGAKNWGKGSKK